VVRSAFLRSLGVVYLAAFASYAAQADALVGPEGILPAERALAQAAETLGPVERWLRVPTLCWLGLSPQTIAAAGVLLAILLIAGVAPIAVLPLCWIAYLSLERVSGVFLGYQWDSLLVETGFLAILFAPRAWLLHRDRSPPPPIATFLARWLLFRLMFFSGVVKLASGDPAWRDLTALEYHWWTQPLPAWTAWFVHQLPRAAHLLVCAALFVIELFVPFLVFFRSERVRIAAFAALVSLQAGIAVTGSYAFFNLLTIVLCIPILDDRMFRRDLPPRVAGRGERIALALGAAVILHGSIGMTLVRFRAPALPGLALSQAFGVSANYGLFAVMTKTRPEIVLEGSADGVEWRTYEFPYKPGRLDRRPRFAAPHQPRVDWQMWFAALGDCRRNGWLLSMQRRLLEGADPVEAVFADDPFDGTPPAFLRTTLFEYRFAPPGSSDWWVREPVGPYCPVLALDSGGNLVAVE